MPAPRLDNITLDEAKALFSYDPEEGILRWAIDRPRIRKGSIAGKLCKGYYRIKTGGKHYMAHRIAWLLVYGRWPVLELDHINRVKTDNRICNLREVPHSRNMWNTAQCSAPLAGTFLCRKTSRWRAVITRCGTRIFLGSFYTREDAHKAYLSAASLYEAS